MRYLLLILLFIVALPLVAYAEVYIWKDDAGKSHAAGKMKDVPPEYRLNVKIIKSSEDTLTYKSRVVDDEGVYGGETAKWWKEQFADNRALLKDLREGLVHKEMFVDVYERGWVMRQLCTDLIKEERIKKKAEKHIKGYKDYDRSILEKTIRYGELYSPTEIDTYSRYKREIDEERKDLVELEEKLWKLDRDAKYYDVPYEIWKE